MSDRESAAFARFAAAHLRTDLERSVFFAVTSMRGRAWTAAQVAREAGVSDHEADQTLRRFGAAGIVERIDERGHGRRYRWRPEMAYLESGSHPAGLCDPVCGMTVAPDSPHVADEGAERVVFCSLPCLVLWRAARRLPPEIGRAASPNDRLAPNAAFGATRSPNHDLKPLR